MVEIPWGWGGKPKPLRKSVFSGVGCLAADEDPNLLLALAPHLDWIALRPDLQTPELAYELVRAHDICVHVWESYDSTPLGQMAVERFNACGYIGQDENLSNALDYSSIADSLRVPSALVTNNWDAHHINYEVIPESYWCGNENASPVRVIADAQNLGAKGRIPSVCFGLFPAEAGATRPVGTRVLLRDYLAALPKGFGWCFFRPGTMDPDDLHVLKGLRR